MLGASAPSRLESAVLDLVAALEARRDRGAALDLATRALAEDLGGTAIAYRAALGAGGWRLDFFHAHGSASHGLEATFRNYLRDAPLAWGLYDAIRPAPEDRNRVRGAASFARALESGESDVVTRFYRKLELRSISKMRVLLCDGPVLLGWLGAIREQPFEPREERLLARLVPPLLQRLCAKRPMASVDCTAALLEEITSPAFLIGARGTIELTNHAGRTMLDREGAGLAASLSSAVAEPRRYPAFRITRIPPAAESFALVVASTEICALARLARARRLWGLTARQAEVLSLLVRGDSNKDIAIKLACTPRTAELHVCAILRKAGVETRAQVVAQFWIAT